MNNDFEEAGSGCLISNLVVALLKHDLVLSLGGKCAHEAQIHLRQVLGAANLVIDIRFSMAVNLWQGKLTITIDNVNGHVWIIQVGRDAQDAGPSIHDGTVLELSKHEVEPTGGTVKLIFEWLDCLLVDAAAFGSVIIQDANVGECRQKRELRQCRCRLLLLLLAAGAAGAAVAGPEEPVGLAGVVVHPPC